MKIPQALMLTKIGINPKAYINKIVQLLGSDLLRFYPLNDASGTTVVDFSPNSKNAVVNGSPTFLQRGINGYDSLKSIKFPTSSSINLYSADLASNFNYDEFSASIWFLAPDANWWTDSAGKYFFRFQADGSNFISLWKNASNLITLSLITGGVNKGAQIPAVNAVALMNTIWNNYTVTFSRSNNRARLFLNGSKYVETTGVGAWAGTIGSNLATVANYAPANATYANLGYNSYFYLAKRELTEPEVGVLSNPFQTQYINFFAIGDSKTANYPNWTLGLIDLIFSSSNRRMIKLPTPYAAGGWTTQNVKDGIDTALTTRTDVPNYILINLGANDVNSGDPGTTWKTNTAYIANAVHTKWPNAPVYLTKVWRRNTGLQAAGIAAINGYIDQLVADPAYSGWLKIGPNEANFLPSTDDGATYTTDGTHPSPAGILLEAQAWKTALGL